MLKIKFANDENNLFGFVLSWKMNIKKILNNAL